MSISLIGQLVSLSDEVLSGNVQGTAVPVPGPPPQHWNGLLNTPALDARIAVGDELRLVLAEGRCIDIRVTEVLSGAIRIRGAGALPR
jgi:hypothetical protein